MSITKGPSHPRRKEIKRRRTFTLSPESIALLEELSSRRGTAHRESVSAVLDQVLKAMREAQIRDAMERATTAYYDGRPKSEEEEESDWARFALSQFPVDDVNYGDSK